MIDVRGLRIGNWLNGSHNGFSKDVQVYAFDHVHIQHTDESNKPLPIESFKPIPLTEDWHIKFGAIKNGFNDFVYIVNKSKTIVFSGDYIFMRDFDKNINSPSMEDNICTLWNNDERKRKIFVHEWQNIYYLLTETELTIKNE